jgi:hypothetical protein
MSDLVKAFCPLCGTPVNDATLFNGKVVPALFLTCKDCGKDMVVTLEDICPGEGPIEDKGN